MFRKSNRNLKKFKYFIFIYIITFEIASCAMEEDGNIELNEDILSVVSSIYKELEDYDNYPQRLENLWNQAINFPDAHRIRRLTEESMLDLLKIEKYKNLDLLVVIKLKEIEEKWSIFFKDNREEYLQKLEDYGINTNLISDHKSDMENLKNAEGILFFEKLAQKWDDIYIVRKIYQQAYKKKKYF